MQPNDFHTHQPYLSLRPWSAPTKPTTVEDLVPLIVEYPKAALREVTTIIRFDCSKRKSKVNAS